MLENVPTCQLLHYSFKTYLTLFEVCNLLILSLKIFEHSTDGTMPKTIEQELPQATLSNTLLMFYQYCLIDEKKMILTSIM